MKRLIAVGIAGALFGVGLEISGMTQPAKVQAFLDVFGNWDASLMLVLAAAVSVATLAFRWILRQPKPLFAPAFTAQISTVIDARLIGGSVLFGIGWALAGYCPAPALAVLPRGQFGVFAFVLAMFAGMALVRFALAHRVRSA